MNHIRLMLNRVSILVSSIVIISLSSLPLAASDDITINLSTEGCEVFAEAEDNRCDAGQCDGDSACICAKKGQFLIWEIDSEDSFKLIFSGEDPLRDNCGKNYKASQKCKIKEEVQEGDDYSYLIKLERCDDGSDPRIVIRP